MLSIAPNEGYENLPLGDWKRYVDSINPRWVVPVGDVKRLRSVLEGVLFVNSSESSSPDGIRTIAFFTNENTALALRGLSLNPDTDIISLKEARAETGGLKRGEAFSLLVTSEGVHEDEPFREISPRTKEGNIIYGVFDKKVTYELRNPDNVERSGRRRIEG